MANPNPSPETRFGIGNPGNANGKTSEQRKAEIANAERATRIRGRMLEALEKSLDDALEVAGSDAASVAAIGADVLRLMKEAEDRGFGAPTAKIEGPGANGEHLHKVGPDEAFQRLASRLGSAAAGTTGIDPSQE